MACTQCTLEFADDIGRASGVGVGAHALVQSGVVVVAYSSSIPFGDCGDTDVADSVASLFRHFCLPIFLLLVNFSDPSSLFSFH